MNNSCNSINEWILGTTDWLECFRLAKISISDVAKVIAFADGENFGNSWICLLEMKDSKFVFISGSCNMTTGNGQDNWEENDCKVFVETGTKERLIQFFMSIEDRKRLGFATEEEIFLLSMY